MKEMESARNRQRISSRDVISEYATILLRAKPPFAGVDTGLVDVHKIDRFCVSAQKFGISAVTTCELQRRSEIFILDDRPDRSFPLHRHEFFGVSKIKTGPMSVRALRNRYPANDLVDGFSDGGRRRICRKSLQASVRPPFRYNLGKMRSCQNPARGRDDPSMFAFAVAAS